MLKRIKSPLLFVGNLIKEIVNEVRQVDFLGRSATVKYSIYVIVALVVGTISLITIDRLMFAIRNLILNF